MSAVSITQCWNCPLQYPMDAAACPACNATNGNHDPERAAQEATSPRKPVMQVLNAVDDHLQAMQHYAHSHDLREAMSTVQEVLEALHWCFVAMRHGDFSNGVTDPTGSTDEGNVRAGEIMRQAEDAIAKALGRPA